MPTQQQQLRQQQKQQPPAGQPAAGASGGKGAGATPVAPSGQRLKPMAAPKQQALTQATQKGNLDVFLANHPGVQNRFNKVAAGAGNANQRTKVENWQKANAAAKAAGQPPAPSTGAPAGKPGPPPNTGTPTASPEPGPPPSFLDAFNTAMGAGASDTLGPMAWTGPNPIETARKAAQLGLDENLANVRARYAGSGFGNSAREGLAEGQAVGDFATKFGDVAAARGLQERETGLDRLASSFMGAGQQDLQGRALGMQANQAMANLGTGTTAIGAQEQEIPNLSNAIALLTNMAQQGTRSRGAMHPPKG